MPRIVKLEPGVDPTAQINKLPNYSSAGKLIVAGGILLALALLCGFGIPYANAQLNPPTETPTPPLPSPTPTVGPTSTERAGSGGSVQTVVETVQVEVPGPTQLVPVTQIVNQSNTVIVTRVVTGPTVIQTQIVQVPVTQLIPVTQLVVVTVPWIITATPQPPTMPATASNTPTPTITPSPTPMASPTPTQTPTPTETETGTP